MTTNIDNRKNIIISLKSYYGERKKGIDKQIQFLKKMNFMHIFVGIFCFWFLMTSIISEQINYDFFKWQKTGLLSLLSLMAFLNLPNGIFELKLLTHFKKINEYKDFIGIEKLNDDLKFQVDKLNNRIGTNIIPLFLGMLILIMGAWQTMNENNPYWKYMKIPVILFFGFIITRFIIINKKLTKNIRKVENSVATTS
ncbi:MAG TPA: hypothetical protein VIN72_14075 [Lutibacter sp.]